MVTVATPDVNSSERPAPDLGASKRILFAANGRFHGMCTRFTIHILAPTRRSTVLGNNVRGALRGGRAFEAIYP